MTTKRLAMPESQSLSPWVWHVELGAGGIGYAHAYVRPAASRRLVGRLYWGPRHVVLNASVSTEIKHVWVFVSVLEKWVKIF